MKIVSTWETVYNLVVVEKSAYIYCQVTGTIDKGAHPGGGGGREGW